MAIIDHSSYFIQHRDHENGPTTAIYMNCRLASLAAKNYGMAPMHAQKTRPNLHKIPNM